MLPATWPFAIIVGDFVRAGGVSAASLGSFPLKGVALEQEIFVPAD